VILIYARVLRARLVVNLEFWNEALEIFPIFVLYSKELQTRR